MEINIKKDIDSINICDIVEQYILNSLTKEKQNIFFKYLNNIFIKDFSKIDENIIQAYNIDMEYIKKQGNIEYFLSVLIWSIITDAADETAYKLISAYGYIFSLKILIYLKLAALKGEDLKSLFQNKSSNIYKFYYNILNNSDIHKKYIFKYLTNLLDKLFANNIWQSVFSANSVNAQLISIYCANYPKGFYSLGSLAPIALWARGNASLLSSLHIATIVGSRFATDYGSQACYKIVSDISKAGFVVASGGAYGIDKIAHKTALREKTPTIAILAGGIDSLYPKGNETLFRDILYKGVIISEEGPGVKCQKWRFLARNRLLAAIPSFVIVIQAANRSGALSTAHHALSIGKPLGCVPGDIFSHAYSGCNKLIYNRHAWLISSGLDALELAGDTPKEIDIVYSLGAETIRVYEALDSSLKASPEKIASFSGLSLEEVLLSLQELKLLERAYESENLWVACKK